MCNPSVCLFVFRFISRLRIQTWTPFCLSNPFPNDFGFDHPATMPHPPTLVHNPFDPFFALSPTPPSPSSEPECFPLLHLEISSKQIGIAELPPIPTKIHYTFDLKDLSRICYGMQMIQESQFALPMQLVRVWRNEFMRVICDRFSNEQVRWN